MLGIAVLLVLFSATVDSVDTPDISIKKNITQESINQILDSVYSLYDIKQEWIKKKFVPKLKLSKSDLMISEDIPMPMLINDLQNSFYGYNLTVLTKEKVMHGKTIIQFVDSAKHKVYEISINYDKNLLRNRAETTILADNFTGISGSDLVNIMQLPFHFTALLVPDEESQLLCDSLYKNDKSYGLLITDQDDESKYQFGEKFSELRVRTTIENIINDFPDYKLLMADTKTRLYSSKVFRMIQGRLKTLKMNLTTGSEFISLIGKEAPEQISILKYHCENSKADNKLVFLVSNEDIKNITEEVMILKKRGTRFIPFTN